MYISNPELLLNHLSELSPNPNETLFIGLAENTEVDVLKIIKILNERSISFFGGILPSVINGSKKYDQGAIIKTFSSIGKPVLVKNIGNKEFELPNLPSLRANTSSKSCIVLIDGLTKNISSFLSALYNEWGDIGTFLGGGAGSLSLKQQPCLFNESGIHQDAAIFTFIPQKCNLGVKHGWKKFQGPFIATKTERNIIKELNWQNAYSIYKTAVEANSNRTFDTEDFFDIAKGYPFGISKENSESIVRDPIAVNENGELICVGEIRENTVLDILSGNKQSLLDAASQLFEENLTTKSAPVDSLTFDCISRVLFLESEFEKEIEIVQNKLNILNPSIELEGALTLGEISSKGGKIEFLNKSLVVGLFYE